MNTGDEGPGHQQQNIRGAESARPQAVNSRGDEGVVRQSREDQVAIEKERLATQLARKEERPDGEKSQEHEPPEDEAVTSLSGRTGGQILPGPDQHRYHEQQYASQGSPGPSGESPAVQVVIEKCQIGKTRSWNPLAPDQFSPVRLTNYAVCPRAERDDHYRNGHGEHGQAMAPPDQQKEGFRGDNDPTVIMGVDQKQIDDRQDRCAPKDVALGIEELNEQPCGRHRQEHQQ